MNFKISISSVAISAVFAFSQANAQQISQIKGANVLFAQCEGVPNQFGNAVYVFTNAKKWAYADQNGYMGTSDVKGRDEWSIYLKDNQQADVQIDLWTKKCIWSKAGSSKREYKLVNAGAAN